MLTREQLTTIVRLLIGIGIFMLMLAFMRACFSPPQLPAPKPGNSDTMNHGTLPPGYGETLRAFGLPK